MGLKTSIRRQIAKFLGTHSLQNDVAQLVEINKKLLSQLQNLQALNALSAPCIPSSIKDSFYLQSFPSYGGLRACYSDKAGQNIREFLRLTRPIASKSIKLRRFGGAHDGGYVMAIPPHLSDTLSGVSLRTLDNITMADFTLKLGLQNSSNDSYLNNVFTPPPPVINSLDSKVPVAISLGVSPYSPWDLEMANLGYKVLQYDASIESAPYNHKNITFFKKFVGVSDSENTISLQNVITQNALDSKAFNILQCDIEDSEWAILDKIDLNLMAKYFPQVLFEFHNCNPDNDALCSPRLKILSKLRDFYTPIFTHFNHYAPAYFADGAIFCDVIEVSYIRNDLVPQDSTPFSGCLNIKGLSASNEPGVPDLPVIF